MNEYHCNFTHKHVLVVVYYKRRNDNYNIEFIKYSYEMVNTNNRDRDRLIKRNPISNHYSSSSSRFFLIKKKVDECRRPEVNATN